MAQDTLAAKVRAKYPGVYDDLDDATLEQKVRAKFPGVYDDIPSTPVTPAAPAAGPSSVNAAADWLPTVGGMVGGMVGKVPGVRMATAAIGGAAGEGYRQLVTHGAEIPGAVADVARNLFTEPTATLQGFKEGAATGAKQAAVQGAIQAAAQGGGEVVGAVASRAPQWLMNRALNLTDKLSREFPNASATMLEHALVVSRGGLEKARALLRAAKTTANAALAKAQAAGAKVPITAATDGLQQTLVKVLESADVEGGLRALAAVERRIGAGRGRMLTPVEADALKTSMQTQSKTLYTAQKMGQGRPNVTVQAQALADMAASLNEAIGTITEQAGAAGYRAANASAAELIGAVRGITKGIRPGANLYQAMVRPGVGMAVGGGLGALGGGKEALAGTVIGGALLSPLGMSRLANVLQQQGVQQLLKQSPRLAAAIASIMAMQDAEPAAPPK